MKSNFLVRLLNWEYWPWQVIYFPVMIRFCWLSFRARSPFFFFATNPGIETGGLLIESKIEILNRIPGNLVPITLFFKYPMTVEEIMKGMKKEELYFPVIAKPDYGDRGWMVEKIENIAALEAYVNRLRVNLIIQEFIDLPVELGIFYYRIPGSGQGTVSSVTAKQLLHVTGDGSSTLRMLIKESPRARLQWRVLEEKHKNIMNFVPARGEKVELMPIGNHCRGTMFVNRNDLIDKQLITTVDEFARRIPGFYYGRFDLRCADINRLKKGETIRILELNGCKSEPAHIYHPGSSLFKAFRVLFNHWNILYQIAMVNREKGTPFPTLREGWRSVRKYLHYRKFRKNNRPG